MKLDSESSSNHSEKESFILELDKNTDPPRESWGNRFEFLLAVIGYTVGIGSIWRFPIVCVRNGGGAFLVPFCVVLTFIGAPIYYLEINLGQFSGKSPCKAFEFCQLFRGTGILMMTLVRFVLWYYITSMCWVMYCLYRPGFRDLLHAGYTSTRRDGTGYLMVTLVLGVLWYYMTIMSWILYYLYSSFSSVLPWSTCNNDWNTVYCRDVYGRGGDFDSFNTSIFNESLPGNLTGNRTVNPALEFWTNNVLRKSSGLEEMGSVQFHLLIPLFIAWLITNLALINGVKSLGKVVYFTALFPYVLLTILLVRGITLDGSIDGLMFFLKFDSTRLSDYQVWLDASVQVFYSLGPLWGGAITMAAHNKFNQPTLKDTLIVCVIDVITAVYAALVVFSVIGFMAKEAGVPVGVLATSSGPGLAFVAYPTACSLMPLPQLWSVLFFVMMLLVMLDSAFGMVETVLDSLRDLLPTRFAKRSIAINICFAILMLLSGIIYTTNGGIYLFQLIDWYASAFALLIGACLEVTSISLVYGIDRFSKDIKLMTGRDISRLSRFLYCIVIPAISFITFTLMLTKYSAPNYGDGYVYTPYAIALGFFVGLLPVAAFVVIAVSVVLKQDGPLMQKLGKSLTASEAWGPKDRKIAEGYRLEPYIYEDSFLNRLKKNLMGDSNTPWL